MPLSRTELKKLKSLQAKKGRRAWKMFLAEGVRVLEEAARHQVVPCTVYFASTAESARTRRLRGRFEREGSVVSTITARDLRSITDTEAPQGIVGLFTRPETRLDELYRPQYRRLLLCENVSDPGNVGTLIRSALAFDFHMVLLSGSCADPFSPKVVRASAGAIFGMPVAVTGEADVTRFLTDVPARVLAADSADRGDDVLSARALRKDRIMLAIGAEATGLSRQVLRRADCRIHIRHLPLVESLNAAVAGSIIMKQIFDLTHRGN